MIWHVICHVGMILFAVACCASESTVAQTGQSPGWPVPNNAGIFTPAWAIAIERENSNDSVIYAVTGGCLMAIAFIPPHPGFVFVFVAIRHADRHPCICMLRTVVGNKRSARRSPVRDYVLSLVVRLPVTEASRV